MAAFDAFGKWEDEVQKAGLAILGSKFAKAAAKKDEVKKGGGANSGTDAGSNLFTLLAMEEQTRNGELCCGAADEGSHRGRCRARRYGNARPLFFFSSASPCFLNSPVHVPSFLLFCTSVLAELHALRTTYSTS